MVKNYLKLYKKLATMGIVLIAVVLNVFFVSNVLAQTTSPATTNSLDVLNMLAKGSGYEVGATSTPFIAALGSIVRYFLMMLGVLFVCLVLYGGFLWMTARGDSDQVTQGKSIIWNAMVGLAVIIFASIITYAIVYYAFNPDEQLKHVNQYGEDFSNYPPLPPDMD